MMTDEATRARYQNLLLTHRTDLLPLGSFDDVGLGLVGNAKNTNAALVGKMSHDVALQARNLVLIDTIGGFGQRSRHVELARQRHQCPVIAREARPTIAERSFQI